MVASELVDCMPEPGIADDVRALCADVVTAAAFTSMVAFVISRPEGVDNDEILFRPTREEN